MKGWPLIVATFLLLVTPVMAEAPSPGSALRARPGDPPRAVPFPLVTEVTVSCHVDPYTRTRLTVAGPEWQFTLVERRWGWELDSAYVEQEEVRLLTYASLDYLEGEPETMRLFTDVDPEFLALLDRFAH